MKMNRLFMMLAMGGLLISASCTKPDTPGTEGPEEPAKKTEAKLTSFVVTAGNDEIAGNIFETDKVVELPVMPNQTQAVKTATAKVVISEGATITPDPAEAKDYTVEGGIKFTVTSEDGKKSVDYTVTIVEPKFQVKAREVWVKTFGELGVAQYKWNWNCGIGFSGKNFVTADCQVFDLEGAKVGKLNLEGIPTVDQDGFQLLCMSNDINGVLFGSVIVSPDGKIPSGTDAEFVKYGNIYVWENGWDKPATLLIDGAAAEEGKGANWAMYFCVAGDWKGDMLLNHISPGRGPSGAMFHARAFHAGEQTWNAFNTTYPSNDGAWGQWLSATSGDVNGTFVIGDHRSDNKGLAVYARKGLQGEDVELYGTLYPDGLVEEEAHGGLSQYGNYTVGHVRGFQYMGQDLVVACSTGWPAAYVTIQPTNPEEDYILRTQKYGTAAPQPSSAVMIDEENVAHVVVYIGPAYNIVRYDIATELM